jgi:hypothetical protein
LLFIQRGLNQAVIVHHGATESTENNLPCLSRKLSEQTRRQHVSTVFIEIDEEECKIGE